ncbi:Ribosomal RNA small subunit methyltransferase I [Thalassocella blandensis]|nr:Ribosomal RNA small subunit methyltransferase I [Thalassocella blandensis]
MKPENALYIVATPIGNLADMTPRAIEVLQNVDVIAAEDTRHSAKLMQHCNVQRPLIAYHDHTFVEQSERIIARIKSGESLALISDAGTPLISDPGYRLVSLARQAGVKVIPIPGACALITALCAAGLPSDRFMFEGFTPAKSVSRRKCFEALASEARTLVFYESPHRIEGALADMVECFGTERPAVMARELTKTFETFLSGSLGEIYQTVCEDANQQRGEIILLIEGYKKPEQSGDELSAEAEKTMRVLMGELPLKQAAALTAQITGEKKNKLYKWGLEIQ